VHRREAGRDDIRRFFGKILGLDEIDLSEIEKAGGSLRCCVAGIF